MKRFRLRYADWSWREYAAIAACILRGRIAAGPDAGRLAQELNALYAPSAAHALDFGHSALRIALDAFRELEPGRKEVIVPGYICPSVVDTVRAAGLEPRAAEIGPDLNIDAAAVRSLLGPDTLAVVVPHMFGCPAAVGEFERMCRQAGVFMIDDAAQVVGERVEGRLLGSFGDAGIVSFAQSKAVVTGVRGSGGILLVNNPRLQDALARRCRGLAPARGRLGALADFLWNYQWRGVTGNSGYYLLRLGRLLGRARPVSGPMALISNLDAAIARVQLARLGHLCAEKAGRRRLPASPGCAAFGQPAATCARTLPVAPDGGLATGNRRRAVQEGPGPGRRGNPPRLCECRDARPAGHAECGRSQTLDRLALHRYATERCHK